MYPEPNQNLNYETEEGVYWFSSAHDPLSNWSANAVQIWGKRFQTSEHAYHWSKFHETAPEVARQIFDAPSPWAAMRVDRRHKEKRRKDWDDIKAGIMTEIVREKVSQNEDVKEILLKTGDKQIYENSPWDAYWGLGPNGDGQNMMGQILMEIRKEIRKQV